MRFIISLATIIHLTMGATAQPVTNSETAPNTFPNPSNPSHLPVSPSDSIYETPETPESSTELQLGTYAQDTTPGHQKGITRPGKKSNEYPDNKIIIRQEAIKK